MSTQGSHSRALTKYVSRNYEHLSKIPRHGGFTASAIDWDAPDINAAHHNDTITKIGEVTSSLLTKPGRTPIGVWAMTPEARRLIEEATGREDCQMPCGHTGFTNERDTEYLQCSVCGGRFTSGEVRDHE